MKTTKASDIMTKNVISVKRETLLTDVIDLLLRWHISAMPVVDEDNKIVGIVSEIDLVNVTFDGNAADTTVEEVMTTKITSFNPTTELADLVQCFSQGRLRRVPILEKDKVVGIISRRDLLREMRRRYNI